jgi:hypothetical protein
MKLYLTIFVFLAAFSCAAFVQTSHAQGVVFKIPEDDFPMDWNKSGFKGILMLRKDSPSGIFISYPNDGEGSETLRERAVKFVAPTVIADDNGKKDFKLEKTTIPKREGDSADAFYYSFANKNSMVQVIVYERIMNEIPFIYGYFAMKGKDVKPESVKKLWADDKGQGVKIFEKFWKSLKA